jgi:hypothetical protein
MKWCISIVISRIFNIRKLSSSLQWCKKKDLSVGYCERLYLVKNQFDSLMVYVNLLSTFR